MSTLQLTVKDISNNSFKLEFNEKTTVKILREMVSEKKGYPFESIMLVYYGKHLENENDLLTSIGV
jgi:preprotein translocase subunit YajC